MLVVRIRTCYVLTMNWRIEEEDLEVFREMEGVIAIVLDQSDWPGDNEVAAYYESLGYSCEVGEAGAFFVDVRGDA